MRFLIDGHRDRVIERYWQWPQGVIGQLLTPLTSYKLGATAFAIDNGAFGGFKEQPFTRLLARHAGRKAEAMFCVVPDKVGCHATTVEMWKRYNHIADGWRKAFVAQDGFTEAPAEAGALFLGGTDGFKDSDEALAVVRHYLKQGLHVHIGRVNGPKRFIRFYEAGAHTCDGSGVSRYDHMLPVIRDALTV